MTGPASDFLNEPGHVFPEKTSFPTGFFQFDEHIQQMIVIDVADHRRYGDADPVFEVG